MVHCRNALVLSRELGIDLIEGELDAYRLDQPYDNIICNYASFYMPWEAYFDKLMTVQKEARLWWMVNDHDVEDNILLRNILKATNCKRTYGVISNNTREGFRQWILRKWIEKEKTRLQDCIDEWHTINLNALTFKDHRNDKPDTWFRHDMIPAVYWGSWRKWRLPYFLKYSHPNVYFSTSPKNYRKLVENGCHYQYLPPLMWGDNGSLMGANATVYIEDQHTHNNYAYLANRFYEAISYGVTVGFDESCTNTVSHCGYSGCVMIDSPDELLQLAKTRVGNPPAWISRAEQERQAAINQISKIIT